MNYYSTAPAASSSYYESPMTSSASDPYPAYTSASYYTSSYSTPTTYQSHAASYPPTTAYSSAEASYGTSNLYACSTGYTIPSVTASAYPSPPAYGMSSGSLYSTPSEGDSPNGYSDWSSHGRLKEHMCNVPGCSRSEGFTTQADLNRHQKSVHRVRGKYWLCLEPTCPKYKKEFPRKDNLQDHLKRVHQLGKDDRDSLAEQWAISKD